MSEKTGARRLSRRRLLELGGNLTMMGVGAGLVPLWKGGVLNPVASAKPAALAAPAGLPITVTRHLVGTDGWIYLPGSVPPWSPDPYGPSVGSTNFTTYIFGFRDVTGLADNLVNAQKNKAQHSAPLLFFDELDSIQIDLTNLSLGQRPDLTDPHTIHWHGFRNALPIFDGVPEMSISVPISSTFPFYYHPHDPGTYMYHCHNEDVEHVQMGMSGVVFVRPAQNKTGNGAGAPIARYNGSPSGAVARLRLQ